jgi:hypothetical protein
MEDLVWLLGAAFEEYGRQRKRQWRLMAVFVLEIACKGVVYDAKTVAKLADGAKALSKLEADVAHLKSLRGRLTRKCRTIHDQNDTATAALRQELHDLRSHVAELEDELSTSEGELERTVSSKSAVRADVFREMIKLARSNGSPRYSNHLYYMAVVILYRSPSTYDFLRQFLPLPSPVSIYHHFQVQMTNSLARLQTLELVIPFLSTQIELHPELSKGAVVAVDAISCSNAFVGMKKVDRGNTAYLFVCHLQPLSPRLKCTPLFVMESESGIGNDAIQAKIDTVLQLTQSQIARLFIASDGDPSYNKRHKTWMKEWIKKWAEIGFDQMVLALKEYPGILPLSDLLHIAKNFRVRFLKYKLTFSSGHGCQAIDQDKVRAILDLQAPLTDLSPLGKMRDVYPIVLMRVEHIVALIEQDTIPEAVALLPMSLCFAAIRLETITRETRSTLLRINFFLAWKLYEMRKCAPQCM